MDQQADIYATPIIEIIGGKEITFPRLLSEDYAALEEQVRQIRIKFLTGLIDRAKLEGTDKFIAWRDNYTPWIDPNQVAGFLLTSDGARMAVKMSLKKGLQSDDAAKEIVGKFFHNDLANLALALIGMAERRRPVFKVADEKTESAADPTSAPPASPEIGAESTLISAEPIPA